MGTALTGLEIKDTYDGLVKTTDNGPLTGSLKKLTDGLGNDSSLSLSTTAASLSGTLAVTGNATFDTDTLFVDAAANEVGVGTASPAYKFNVVTDAVLGKQNLAAISRTAQNFVTFTNPQFSTDASMGLLLRVFPQSDARQGAGIIASGGTNNAATDLDLFVTTSPDGSGGTSYSALKILSTGNVGIGTSSPAYKLSVSGKLGVGASFNSVLAVATFDKATAVNTFTTASNYLQIGAGENAASSTRLIGFGYSITANTNQPAYIGYIETSNTDETKGDLIFGTRDVTTDTAPTERVRILSGGGLTFNGDTAAANALDDYEEGTWTTGVSFGGASVGVTTSATTGTYTKIGRQVTVNGLLVLTSKGSSTGAAKITGLPFTVGNSTGNYAPACLLFDNIAFANQFQGRTDFNTTIIDLFEVTELGVVTTLTNADFANNSTLAISLTYFV
jgi:hypothetical protein